jgi:hypothetical protein
MIESQEKRKQITEIIERWCEHTKVKLYLREYDIPGLVGSVIEEFYHVRLCCGHWVKSIDEGINLEIDELEGKAYGSYCKDCAKEMIKEDWAREIKEENSK